MQHYSTSGSVAILAQPMIPNHPPAKRKALDDSNPLLNAAKKPKKEPSKSGSSNKRKLLNGEEQPGGLIIVRASDASSSSQPAERPPSRSQSQRPSQPANAVAGPSHPPTKKFKAGSQPPPSKSALSKALSKSNFSQDDREIEQDVRAMNSESDSLRSKRPAVNGSSPSSRLQLPVRPSGTPKRSREKNVDTSQPLPTSETPQIQRNKAMRSGDTSRGASREPDGGEGVESKRGHRRRSSLGGRGKRISDAFEASGVIAQPHNTVADASFFKHIDMEQPDIDRVRQLLIWCSSRAASSTPDPSLPELSDKAAKLLNDVQQDIIKMLADKEIDLSARHPIAGPSGKVNENEQNVSNRAWEVTYSEQIQRCQKEDEAWKQASSHYDSYLKKEQSRISQRKAELHGEAPLTPSAKAKGKRKATDGSSDGIDESRLPLEHELSAELQSSSRLARSVLGILPDLERTAGQSREGREAEVLRQVSDVEFKLDQLHSYANTARATANAAQRALDQRFALLSAVLTARSNPFPQSVSDPGQGDGVHLLSTYVPREGMGQPDAQQLMRALTRIDRERPLAKVGDAARQADRDVQRVEESGAGAVGERRLTGVPSSSQTPRKMPGTPRRGNTPGKDKER
ncbi:Mis12-Mtw1 protein family-domain-containing protein [Mycena floridula]|nr:Mis12-Mtw1 protein family-domain-containing protein [Mycena floridula]